MDYHVARKNNVEEQLQMAWGNTYGIILSERRYDYAYTVQSQLCKIYIEENTGKNMLTYLHCYL